MTDYYKVHDADILKKLESLPSDEEFNFIVQTGSRFIVSVYVESGEVSLQISNGYSSQVPFQISDVEGVNSPNALTTGHHKFVVTDFHKMFNLKLIPNGAASCALGIAVHDNAFKNVSVDDGEDQLEINSDGSINVRLTNNTLIPQAVKQNFFEVVDVPKDIETLIGTFIAPVGLVTYLQSIDVSGDNVSKYILKIDGENRLTKRTSFGSSLNIFFNLEAFNENGVIIPEGGSVKMYVIHKRPFVSSYEMTVQTLQVG